VSLHAHNQADGQLKTHMRKSNLTMKIPLPVLVVALSKPSVATQDRVIPYYVPNSSIKHSKIDSKNRSQEIL
jgi:hypothetical protein